VHESLEEVALLCRRTAPGELELLVRLEELLPAEQLEAAFEMQPEIRHPARH
jgi:hypothetical protein